MKLHFELHDALYLLNVGPSTIYEDTLPSEARIPLEIKEETFYKFYKKGQIIYPLEKNLDLIGINRLGEKSPLIAKVQITLVQHQLFGGKTITTGEYYIKKIINKDLTKI